MENATGIKRFQDNKGYGDWFNPLFNLLKIRDACQRKQAIEPSASGTITSTNTDDSSSALRKALEEATSLLKQPVEKDLIKQPSIKHLSNLYHSLCILT